MTLLQRLKLEAYSVLVLTTAVNTGGRAKATGGWIVRVAVKETKIFLT